MLLRNRTFLNTSRKYPHTYAISSQQDIAKSATQPHVES
jgi:hypothetical protein